MVLRYSRVRNSVRVVDMVYVRRVLLILLKDDRRLVWMDSRLFVNNRDGGSEYDCRIIREFA